MKRNNHIYIFKYILCKSININIKYLTFNMQYKYVSTQNDAFFNINIFEFLLYLNHNNYKQMYII